MPEKTSTRSAGRSQAPISQELTPRAEALRRCADMCHETLTYCLERGGEHAELEHIRCLIDTAELCAVAANAIARESEHVKELLDVCADVCECTAESCDAFDDDAQMRACAEACGAAAEFARKA